MTPNQEETALLMLCVSSYGSWLANQVSNVIRSTLSLEDPPPTVRQALDSVAATEQALDQLRAGRISTLPSELLPVVKRALLYMRRVKAAAAEDLKTKTDDPQMLVQLDRHVRPLDALINSASLADLAPAATVDLTPLLSVVVAEQIRGLATEADSANLDDKFRILRSQRAFLTDLARVRQRCALRHRNVAVAFLDIDKFKEFNETLTETVVDRRVLPRLMQLVESYVFGRGFAYRFGGDEYVVLAINLDRESAASFFDGLRRAIEVLDYSGIDRTATASIGYCEVMPDCSLTEREVLDRAALAKRFAKRQGRNRVATFKSNRLEERDLVIVAPLSR